MAKRPLRKGLSAPGLLCEVRACFEAVDDPVQGRGLSLADCLMSGLAVSGLKYLSLTGPARHTQRSAALAGTAECGMPDLTIAAIPGS